MIGWDGRAGIGRRRKKKSRAERFGCLHERSSGALPRAVPGIRPASCARGTAPGAAPLRNRPCSPRGRPSAFPVPRLLPRARAPRLRDPVARSRPRPRARRAARGADKQTGTARTATRSAHAAGVRTPGRAGEDHSVSAPDPQRPSPHTRRVHPKRRRDAGPTPTSGTCGHPPPAPTSPRPLPPFPSSRSSPRRQLPPASPPPPSVPRDACRGPSGGSAAGPGEARMHRRRSLATRWSC